MMEIATLSHATQLHAKIIKTGDDKNIFTLSKLLTFSALSPYGSLPYALSIFKSLHPPTSYFFNTLLRGYAKSDNPDEALLFFLALHQQGQSPKPDKFTYPFLFKSCSRLQAAREGKQLHTLVCKSGLESDRFVQNSLIHMYSSCGGLSCARRVFERMTERDVVSWTSIIDGHVDCGSSVEALLLFEQMHGDGVAPNDATVVSVLRACADAGSLTMGEKVHKFVARNNMGWKANVVTALIDMYTKCGSIDNARQVFEEVAYKDVFVWTAMITGLASHGQCRDAIDLFHQMQIQKIKPDESTITAVLSSCRNMGWVIEGSNIFNNIETNYGLRPNIQHYGCMVDLLARAGHLSEAEDCVRKMPIKPDAIIWRTLIWACKVHGDTERGERLLDQKYLLEMDSRDSGTYVLLRNFYASVGKWRKKARVRKLMAQRNIQKLPGCSKIEVNGVIHEFAAGDSSHPEARHIYGKLAEIVERLRMTGYRPKVAEVLLDIEDEEKASQLSHHSEKLAVAFGLIRTKPAAKLLVVKNLRSCEDCHSVMKLVSKIYGREIIIRDRIRFHHFKNGCCSCGDYW